MKKIKILIFIISLLMLTACSKNKNESYVSKSREVDSVFDKINVPNRSEREKLNKEIEEETDKESEAEDESADETEEESIDETETEIDEDAETKTTLRALNMRQQPVGDAEIIMEIEEDETVIILEEDAGYGWTKIEYDGEEGFVDGSLLN